MFEKNKVLLFLQKNYQYLILYLLILFVIVSNIVWLQIDNSLIENRDSKVFLSRTVEFIESVKSPGFQLVDSLRRLSHNGRPVILQLSSIPFLLLLGNSIDAYTYFNFWFYILLLIATYQIGLVVKDKNTGLLAAILVACYPSSIRLSKIPLTSFAIIACLALTTWLLLKFMKSQSLKDIWLVNLSISFGLLVHPSFLWGITIPGALFIFSTVFFATDPKWIFHSRGFFVWLIGKLRQPIFLYGLLPSSFVSIGAIIAWYLPIGKFLLGEINNVDSWVSEGMRFFLGPSYSNFPYVFWYIASSGFALSTVLALLFWMGLIASNVTRQPHAVSLAVLFLGSYISHIVFVYGMSWRYFAQSLPIIAVITAMGVYSFRNRFLSTGLAIICVVISIFNFTVTSWGVNSMIKPVSVFLGIGNPSVSDYCRPSFGLYCPDPPDPEYWPVKEIVGTILADPACKDGNCNVVVLPADVYFFEAIPISLLFDFPGAVADVNILLDPGVWGMNVDKPLKYLDIPSLLESDYIVYNLPDTINTNILRSSVEQYQAIQSFFDKLPPLFSASHKLIAEYEFPNGTKAILYKRVQPLTLEEAEQAVSAIELPETEKVRQYGLLLDLSKNDEDVKKWLFALQEELEQAPKPEPYHTLLVEIGNYYQSSGQNDLAISSYQHALEINPNDAIIQVNLARIFMLQGDCESAIPHLEMGANLQPAIARRYISLGDAYRMCARLEDAIASYQTALRIDSKDVFAHLGLGFSFADIKEFQKAQTEFEKVIELSPGSSYAMRAEQWLKVNADKFK